MRIVDTTSLDWSPAEQLQLQSLGEFIKLRAVVKNEIELIRCLQDASYAILAPIFESNISRSLFKECPNLKGISLASSGTDWIDVSAAKKQEIIVSNCADYSTFSVAEFAIAMMLHAVRRVAVSTNATNPKNCSQESIGFELKNKVLGVVGLGSIGSYVAHLGQGLGMRVIGYNRTYKDSLVPLVSIEDLLQISDVVVLSLALNKGTENFLSSSNLLLLKHTSIIINISREELVDRKAIYELLAANKIASYVFELDEPRRFPIDEELLKLNNVTATPHTAWHTFEALTRLKQITIENICGMISGNPINRI
jgi:phosphoglycerate dehydrogenase-like enzyme